MSELKVTVTLKAPKLPKKPNLPNIRVTNESDKEVSNRMLKLHQNFAERRRFIESQFKKNKISLGEYHSAMFQLAQEMFIHGLFINWKRYYLNLDGQRKMVVAAAPI